MHVTTKRESPFLYLCNTTYYVGELAVNNRIYVPLRIKVTSVVYVIGVLALVIYGFIAALVIYGFIDYSVIPIANVAAMTIALYAASFIIVGVGLKQLPTAFAISVLSVVIADLCFAFLHPFIALSIFFFVLLVAVRYSLIKDHDSGWLGAFFVELMGLVFLLPIAIILVVPQLFPF